MTTHPNWRKLSAQMLIGALFGGSTMGVALYVWKDRALDTPGGAQLVALVAGVIYALIGVLVAFGVLAPRAGAKFLNVEDVEELRDQRPILRLSAVACVLTGLFFLILAVVPAGGESGMVSPALAAAVAAACFVALIVLTSLTNRKVDELTRQVSLEASSLTLQAAFLLYGGWAVLAHLGFAQWISPLAFVASLSLLLLAAVFWIGTKRGMVIPEEKRA